MGVANTEVSRSKGTPSLAATTLAQYVRLESCDRYLWYRLHPNETRDLFREYRVTEQPLTPLLSQKGYVHETKVTEELEGRGLEVVDLADEDVDAFVAELETARTEPRVVLQARLRGTIGTIGASGIADLIVLEPGENGSVRVTVGDAKASRKDRPEHRIQVAFYAMLVRQLAAEAGIEIEEMRGCIWRIPENPDDEQPVPFDLRAYEEAVELLVDREGPVTLAQGNDRAEAKYQLTYKCDGCLYNALCMREAAEEESLGLVPFLSQRDRAALERNGVDSISDLALLKELPPPKAYDAPLGIREENVELVQHLNAEWPLGANLDLHVQRARAAARNWHEDIEAYPWIHGSGFGSMPDPSVHEPFVQVFMDGHHDYVEDRLYLASALVVGPGGEREVLEFSEGPPNDDSEAELVVAWVSKTLGAVRDVAGADEAVVHIYVYDTYDQRVLLDGVRRHIDRLAGLPDFFDLLTETPALSQAMFSFLAQEVRERKNLGILCHSLPLVARRLRFDWNIDGVEYFRRFQARVFDNRRTLSDGRWFESASRFNSQIPLEYAYGAWGELPEPADDSERKLLDPFRVSREDLLGFARARLRALQHIEASFSLKNKYVAKQPVRIPAADASSAPDRSLGDVLLEFLFIEHHAKLQGLLTFFALPVARRVASGQTLLMEALEDCPGGPCRFRIRFDLAGLDEGPALQQMGPEEGDWMVLSEANDGARPWELVHGRIAIVESIEGGEMVVSLEPMSFRNSEFRFGHRASLAVARGAVYVLDPMADDLVAERLLDACRNTQHNTFLHWIEAGAEALPARSVSAGYAAAVRDFETALEQAAGILTPTARQGEVIAEALEDPILLVQGPPGTGKTHTLAWAILARAYAAAVEGLKCHVLVTAMTHTAVDIVLRSVADKLAELDQEPATQHLAEALSGLRVYKELSVGGDVPDGVTKIAADELLNCLGGDLAVVGAVPSGIHRLLQSISKPIAWDDKLFDLLVIDEASQLSLPAAVLGGAALEDDGQALVVGDHRQMPPIVTHDWKHEPRREAQDTRVYASTFESLRDRGFRTIGLDRSFRLHHMHASFLEEHVYADDNVGFHSELGHIIDGCESQDPLVAAALAPEYPVIVIEHAERLSLKRNDTEIAILAPIIETARDQLMLDAEDGLGVVVPHRAQRAALKGRFPDLAAAGAIDTVERFQGGERDLIVVSATASDPEFVLSEAKFLLNPNRLNVALSRSRKKLIVIGSTTIFRLVPADMEIFESALLWKRLRYEFSAEVLWEGEIEGVPVRVSGRRVEDREGAVVEVEA